MKIASIIIIILYIVIAAILFGLYLYYYYKGLKLGTQVVLQEKSISTQTGKEGAKYSLAEDGFQVAFWIFLVIGGIAGFKLIMYFENKS